MCIFGQNSVHSSWGEGVGSGGNVTFSIGQLFIKNVNIPETGKILEGVQHPLEILNSNLNEGLDYVDEIILYPNPSSGEINLLISEFIPSLFQYEIFNSLGQSVIKDVIYESHSKINLQYLATGSYRLEIKKQIDVIKVFQVIKRN